MSIGVAKTGEDEYSLTGLTEHELQKISFSLICSRDDGYTELEEAEIVINEYFFGDFSAVNEEMIPIKPKGK